MYKILGFVGPSGCGKDTAASYLGERKDYHYTTLCTTRPKRNEKDNGYHFLTLEEYAKKVLDGTMLNTQIFRDWYYGLGEEDLVKNKINVVPMSNIMVEQMLEEKRPDINLKIVYICTTKKDRLMHILEREKSPDCYEICRRFLSDKKDYDENIDLIKVTNYSILNNYDTNFYRNIDRIAIIASASFNKD